MKVKIIKLDEFIKEVEIKDNMSINEIFRKLKLKIPINCIIQLNGINVSRNTIIENDSVITIFKSDKI